MAAHPRGSATTVVALTILALVLAGCGNTIRAGAPSARTLQIWYATDDPIERAWSQELAQRFDRTHPAVRVNLVDYGFDDFNVKLQLALSSGHPPDLAYATPRAPGIPIYVQAGKLADLTSTAQRDHWAARLRPGLLADYNAPFGLYGTQSPVPKTSPRARTKIRIYGVPDALAAVGVLYNRRLLARLHARPPASLPAFERDVVRAKRAGFVPLGLGNADGWLGDDWYLTLVNTLLPRSYLESELRLDPSFSFHRPAFLRMAGVLARWGKVGDFTPDFGGLDAQDGVDAFFRGHTLFQLVSSTENAQILSDERATRLPTGLFAFPGPRGRVMPVSGYEGWIVPRQSANRHAAVAFINWLLEASATRFLLDQGALPAAPVSPKSGRSGLQRAYLRALATARPGVYVDAAPIGNLNATMEANVQLLLQGFEQPGFLVHAMNEVYRSRGRHGGSGNRIDGEF